MNIATASSRALLVVCLAAACLGVPQQALYAERMTLDLAGKWRFALDRTDAGRKDQWFKRELPDYVQLPGALQAQGYGDEISTNTPWVLSLYDRLWYLRADYLDYTHPGDVKVPFLCQPPRHYLGAAWFQRDLDIPTAWQGRRLAVSLERPHWETTVWMDGREIGSCNSLVAPHKYDLGLLPQGRHRLTVRVDNRLVMPYRPDAHSVSDSLGASWNGIVGRIELEATSPVWIDDAQVFPNVETKSARVQIRIGNATGQAGHGTISITNISVPVTWETTGGTGEITVPLDPRTQTWDEFNPALQRFSLRLAGESADDSRELVFGLREFRREGRDFLLNGRKVYLRGTHHGGDFPLTGYPPTDVDYWRKLFRTCRQWGLNHVRFHSFCPPEAAFAAADELGVYLQPECGMWNEISPGTAMERMMYDETERMIEAYGNHPSFVMLSPSNEPKGRWQQSLPKWVEHFRRADNRRLYTTGTGWSLIDQPGPVTGADYLSVGRIGLNRVRGNSGWFGRDYASSLQGVDVPVVAHELGQWCAYPDYRVIEKFKGYLQPGNFEIFRDSFRAHGLLEKNQDYAQASGRFQWLCYKEEIEANLRTPGLAGFQLLDLHDYAGQGTALVGLLDIFWEPKGYLTPEEFRMVCGPTVPLARLKTRIFKTTDPFNVDVELAHYGPAPLAGVTPEWRILNEAGETVVKGAWPLRTISIGKNQPLGTVRVDLSSLPAPSACTLVVTGRQKSPDGTTSAQEPAFENKWRFWVYPESLPIALPPTVVITNSWDDAERALAAGRTVLFTPRPSDLDWTCPPLDSLPVFWNRLMNPGWSRMLGLWCDTHHPALNEFPTGENCDWQWADLVRRARAVNLDRLPPELQPVVAAIDDWNRNYNLALIFECRVDRGRLLVCSLDLQNDLQARPVARQLRHSLLDYLTHPPVTPLVAVRAKDLRTVFFNTRVMQQLGAQAEDEGSGANLALDGDPNTFWTTGGRDRAANRRSYPHTLTVRFLSPVTIKGLVLMNRQNDRDHLGDIRDYRLEATSDGETWAEIARGRLLSTWNPQTIQFASLVTTRQLKLTALSGFGNDTSAALAELAVLYAGPKLTNAEPAHLNYERARSTSTDVDEGTQERPRAR